MKMIMKNKKKPNKVKNSAFDFSLVPYILLGIVLATFINIVSPVNVYSVNGSSMEPNFHNGEKITGHKIFYNNKIERYDVVIAVTKKYPFIVIKRVIAMPNETIEIANDGKVYVDGEELSEAYEYMLEGISFPGNFIYPITLQDNEFFIMGDNVNNSFDSRYFGPIKKAQIIAVVDN